MNTTPEETLEQEPAAPPGRFAFTFKEIMGLLSVVAIMIGLPAVIWYYDAVYRPAQFGPDAQVITLTGIASRGMWTTDPVLSHNYWRKSFKRFTEQEIDPTRPVVLRVRSSDVLHSFGIPTLRIRPILVYPGKEITVRIEPEDMEDIDDEIGFLCWQVCGAFHNNMSGKLILRR